MTTTLWDRQGFVKGLRTAGMLTCADAVGDDEFLSILNALAARSGPLMEVVHASTRAPDRKILVPIFATLASWKECELPVDDIMSCLAVKTAGGERMRIVVNQLYFGQTSYTCNRNLCQRSRQSEATASDGEITFIVDIPRAPAIVREAVVASKMSQPAAKQPAEWRTLHSSED